MTTHANVNDRPSLVLFALFGVALVIGAGYAHGALTQRWGASNALEAAADGLADFPEAFSGWSVASQSDIEQEILEVLQCAGHVSRIYKNEFGETVTLAVFAGPPGPISVHTPEVCYSSQEYDQDAEAPRTAVRLSDEGDEFWTLQFESKRPGGAPVRVYYAWSNGGAWEAASAPRFQFAGNRFLYKLQLATQGGGDAGSAEKQQDAGERFLRDLLSTDWRPTTEDAQP